MSCGRVLSLLLAWLALASLVCRAEKLVFSDDFDNFDLSVWQHELTLGGGGNWEFEWYTNNRSNSFVNNSVLYILPTLTADNIGAANVLNGYTLDIWGSAPADVCTGAAFYGCSRTSTGANIINPIQSARLRTAESFSFQYGRVEVRAKLPCGDWIWPAIWLLPRYNSYGQWPASGEIDVVESRGNKDYPSGGANSITSTLHMGPSYQSDDWKDNHAEYTLPSGYFCDDFHVFGVNWTESGIVTYIDSPSQVILDVPFSEPFWTKGGWDKTTYSNPWAGRGNAAPFDQKFYLIFDLAVGGTGGYFPDGMGNKPWSDSDQHAMTTFWNAKSSWYSSWSGLDSALQIDWVKVYQ